MMTRCGGRKRGIRGPRCVAPQSEPGRSRLDAAARSYVKERAARATSSAFRTDDVSFCQVAEVSAAGPLAETSELIGLEYAFGLPALRASIVSRSPPSIGVHHSPEAFTTRGITSLNTFGHRRRGPLGFVYDRSCRPDLRRFGGALSAEPVAGDGSAA